MRSNPQTALAAISFLTLALACSSEEPAEEIVRPVLSGTSYDATVLSKEDAWIEKFDHEKSFVGAFEAPTKLFSW